MARQSRRRRIVGPYFLVAIVLSAGLFMWQKRQHEQQSQNAPPPVIEHQVIDVPETAGAPPLELVEQSARELGLTAKQRQRLDPVLRSYRDELRPLQAEARAAGARFEQYQKSLAGARVVSTQEIQTRMAEVSQLSRRMVALRQRYWEQVSPLLTEAQRTRAGELWRESLRYPKTQEAK